MDVNLEGYKSIVFDCDGVILDSNKIKTGAFFDAALPYGKEIAGNFADYHVQNGGVSRFDKFEFLLDVLVPKGLEGPDYNELLDAYAESVRDGLLNCEAAECLGELRDRTTDSVWYIVSGGAQDELRSIFSQRGLDVFFSGGIYGSPDAKSEILDQLICEDPGFFPALFLGDSKHDHIVAADAGLDFIFLSGWTEFFGWREYCKINKVPTIERLSDLLL